MLSLDPSWLEADRAADTCLFVSRQGRIAGYLLVRKPSARVLALHSYENPEVIALPVERGAGAYLGWIERSVAGRFQA